MGSVPPLLLQQLFISIRDNYPREQQHCRSEKVILSNPRKSETGECALDIKHMIEFTQSEHDNILFRSLGLSIGSTRTDPSSVTKVWQHST